MAGAMPAPAPAAKKEEPSSEFEGWEMVDPEIQELCDHYHIEDRHSKRLNWLMKSRHDTWEADMARMWEVLERAREPAGLLTVKMREMEDGTFVGKLKPDSRMQALTKKFDLDDQAESKLMDVLSRYDEDKKSVYYKEVEAHLEVSNRPSAMVMMLL